MKKYIGFKMIQAEEADQSRVTERLYTNTEPRPSANFYDEGYKVVGPNATKWVPKDQFEKSYLQVGDNNTITQELVDSFIVCYEVVTQQNKITIVTATLANNFTLVESSACVDPANYNEKLGADICKDRIKNKVWFLLGFLLQTAKDGISQK